MQAIRATIRCSKCGCIALPDAIRCPKCGASYNGNGVGGDIIDTINYLSNPRIEIEDEDMQVVRAYYHLTCPRHGKIYIKAMVIGSPIKCPFCE